MLERNHGRHRARAVICMENVSKDYTKDHIHMAATILWHHAPGGELKCRKSVLKVKSPLNVTL